MIYFIQSVTGPAHVKIGRSGKNVRGRLADLQTGNPYDLRLVGKAPGSSRSDERAMHERFAAWHYRGEWFWPSQSMAGFCSEALRFSPREDEIADLVSEAHKRGAEEGFWLGHSNGEEAIRRLICEALGIYYHTDDDPDAWDPVRDRVKADLRAATR